MFHNRVRSSRRSRGFISSCSAPSAKCMGLEILAWNPASSGPKGWETSQIDHHVTTEKDMRPLQSVESSKVAIFIARGVNHWDWCQQCTRYLDHIFEFVPHWWEPAYLHTNGTFHYQDQFDKYGRLVGRGTWLRFKIHLFPDPHKSVDGVIQHEWRDVILFTNWQKESDETRILFLGTDEELLDRVLPLLLLRLQEGPISDPLWMYPIVLNDYLNLQHKATYIIRDLTEIEEERVELSDVPRSKAVYVKLHEVSRWAVLVSELLSVSKKTLEYIVQCHEEFMQQNTQWDPLPSPGALPDTGLEASDLATAAMMARRTHQSFRLYYHMFYTMHCRCESYRERMRNEIQLVFNVMAQNEARASVAIAKATKADSQAMKATSFIALVFLPPTFVSAVFSTTFFTFGEDSTSWQISNQFWVYWVIVIPVTAVCLVVWYKVFFHPKKILKGLGDSRGDESLELGNLDHVGSSN
ncbi:hypothetical protein F5Y14DRAFT_395549 [Nemania sp. NC0429]|nr:hypothetical protein F5Y14DRAFT_395549 [Nemania sp. NC0429]